MIDARELRICNWVINIQFADGSYLQIDKQEMYNQLGSADFRFLESIPLTTDILLKCGFENYDNFNNGDVEFFRFNGVELQLAMFPDEFPLFIYIDNITKEQKEITLLSLHQLQNLFFCLCGKELEINL